MCKKKILAAPPPLQFDSCVSLVGNSKSQKLYEDVILVYYNLFSITNKSPGDLDSYKKAEVRTQAYSLIWEGGVGPTIWSCLTYEFVIVFASSLGLFGCSIDTVKLFNTRLKVPNTARTVVCEVEKSVCDPAGE